MRDGFLESERSEDAFCEAEPEHAQHDLKIAKRFSARFAPT